MIIPEEIPGHNMIGSRDFIIYKILNPINGKVYIGQTCTTLEKRIKEHKWAAKKKSPYAIHNAIRKYGMESFEVEILCHCLSKEQTDLEEIKAISVFNSKSRHGYNMTCGGEGVLGYKPTPECLKKRSIKLKGIRITPENRAKVAAANSRRTITDQQRMKISVANKGRIPSNKGKKISEETRAKIAVTSKGRRMSEEAKRKISIAMMGNKHCLGRKDSDETRAKKSISARQANSG